MPKPQPENLAKALGGLVPKTKTPKTARVLNGWVMQAQNQLGISGPRVGWLVTATVVAAVLQRAVDTHGSPLFLLKGGTLLQYRLPGLSRTTTDIDGLVRGDLDQFLNELDKALAEPWGVLTLVRDEVETINVPNRIIKPRRFNIIASIAGVTWRRVQVEISPSEGNAGEILEAIPAPSLAGFGLPTPDNLISLSMSYQIAQKIHASTDPHDPPTFINDRARDIVDLILLRNLVKTTKQPTLSEIRTAIEDTFQSRATDALATGAPTRSWPCRSTAHLHWESSFASAAESANLNISLQSACNQVNDWLDMIEDA